MPNHDSSAADPDRLILEARAGSVAALDALLVLLDKQLQEGVKERRFRGKSPSRTGRDFVQDTLLKVREQFRDFQSATFEELKNWAWAILHNRHRETKRNRASADRDEMKKRIWQAVTRKSPLLQEALTGNVVARVAATNDELARVYAAFERLKPHERNIIQVHLLDGVPLKEIAAELKEEVGTVRRRFQRALVSLRKLLRSDGQRSE